MWIWMAAVVMAQVAFDVLNGPSWTVLEHCSWHAACLKHCTRSSEWAPRKLICWSHANLAQPDADMGKALPNISCIWCYGLLLVGEIVRQSKQSTLICMWLTKAVAMLLQGQCLLTNAPGTVSANQLTDLHIKTVEP